MSKAQYVSIGGVWRKIVKEYVSINGVWRKVKKTYVSINGVWRDCTPNLPGFAASLRIANSGNPMPPGFTAHQQGTRPLSLAVEAYMGTPPYTWTLKKSDPAMNATISSSTGPTTKLSAITPNVLGTTTLTIVLTDARGETAQLVITQVCNSLI